MNFNIYYLHNFYKNLHNILMYKINTYKIYFKTYIICIIPIKYVNLLNERDIEIKYPIKEVRIFATATTNKDFQIPTFILKDLLVNNQKRIVSIIIMFPISTSLGLGVYLKAKSFSS